jgi:hypothetical protein
VTTVSSVELEEGTRRLAGERFDDYAARGLTRAYEEYVGRRRRTVGPLSVSVNGRSYPSIYAVIADPKASFTSGELRLEEPTARSPESEFLVPFDRIVLHGDGSAELHPPDGAAPRRAIARVLLREHYLVRSRADDAPRSASAPPRIPSLFGTVEQGITLCRAAPLVPFEVALLLYLAEERARFELDLVHTSLLGDPRTGRLAAARRTRRPSRIAWGLDRKIGRGYLSLLAARCLEVLVESNGLSSVDLAHVFGGVRESVDSAMQALVEQKYAVFDPRTRTYRARLEAFLPRAEPSTPTPVSLVRPELRTSVQELIDAADARATCPLCGKPLRAGPHRLLCDDCTAKVGLS